MDDIKLVTKGNSSKEDSVVVLSIIINHQVDPQPGVYSWTCLMSCGRCKRSRDCQNL